MKITDPPPLMCADCGCQLAGLRERLFGAEGRVLCFECYAKLRNEELAKTAACHRARAWVATALTLAAGGFVLIADETRHAGGGLAGVAILIASHVVAEVLAPRCAASAPPAPFD